VTLLILKTGSTLPALAARRGDFEDWILAGLGVGERNARVIDVSQGEPLPDYGRLRGVAITGSHAMVTQRLDWSRRTADWLPGLIERRIPLLAICYGHQLLADALGGRVADNPNGREFGTVAVALGAAAKGDPLLGGLPNPCPLCASHTQAVVELPPQTVALASSARDPHQAFRAGPCAWGVQFHPEFDRGVVTAYIEHCRDSLAAEGQDPDRLIAEAVETPQGTELLQRFGRIVAGRS
jgi:GMP synthase (glutamine-hydrolysing)